MSKNDEQETDLLDINNVYPSIDELVPKQMRNLLPFSLVETLTDRYSSAGTKYMTDLQYVDGRYINQIAIREDRNLQSMLEEIDDAIFNWLGWAIMSFDQIDMGRILEANPKMVEAFDLMVACYKLIAEQKREEDDAT